MWADAVPNLLIGLREGLEAGLVVSILLAARRKSADPERAPLTTAPIWLGVLGAVAVAASFAAVLTFSTSELSTEVQDGVSGALSVLAVGLVTAMVFWMRRAAAGLSAHLRGEVDRAAAIGAGALAITAFLAVAREGLETTLFLWTAVQASGTTVAPLIGAGLGLGAAVVLCALLYHQAVRLNLGVFFNRTALALLVIAAGVLAYGLGDLQDAGVLPGGRWVAFDLTARIDPNSWWASIVSGVTDLEARMTALQAVAWIAYLGTAVTAFVRSGHPRPVTEPAESRRAALPVRGRMPSRWAGLAARRPWAVGGTLVVVPAALAGAAIAALPAARASASTALTITASSCAKEWTSAHPGRQSFEVTNRSGKAAEIALDDASGAVVAEIETIGPATTAAMSARLGSGTYTFRCVLSGLGETASKPVQVTGGSGSVRAVKPVSAADLAGPNARYQAYAARQLASLASSVAAIRADLVRGDRAAAERDWLAAQLSWERVGASYNSFGRDGVAVDGLPDGLRGGVEDPDFIGLHRLEYGLYHGQATRQLLPVVTRLASDVATVGRNLRSDELAGDPTNLPLRAHEIIEDAQRDHLSGIDDEGGGAGYAMTYADTQVDRVVIGELARLLDDRAPGLPATIDTQLDTLQRQLLATRVGGRWRPPERTSLQARQRVNGAIGELLESLSVVPDLLEVPPSR